MGAAGEDALTAGGWGGLLEAAGIGYYRCDLLTGDITWSDGLYRLAGLPRGQRVTADDVHAMVHPDDRDGLAALFGDRTWRQRRFRFRLVPTSGPVIEMTGVAHREHAEPGQPVVETGIVQAIEPSTDREQSLLTAIIDRDSTIELLQQTLQRQHARAATLRAATITDPVSGALNRRGLEERIRAEMARARRQGGRLSLAVVDLVPGRAAGRALADVAASVAVKRCRQVLRESDHVARLGPLRLGLLLPDTDEEGAEVASQRVVEAVSGMPVAVPGFYALLGALAGSVELDPFERVAMRTAVGLAVRRALAIGWV